MHICDHFGILYITDFKTASIIATIIVRCPLLLQFPTVNLESMEQLGKYGDGLRLEHLL